MLYRSFVSFIAAAIVFCVLLLSAWINLSDDPTVCRNQTRTRALLRQFSQRIEQFRAGNGAPPKQIADIPGLQAQAANQRLDRWNHPLEYHPHENGEYDLFSLGRDGRPGGAGLDADLYHDRREGKLARPTLSQFVFTLDGNEIYHWTFLIAGFAAACVTFTTVFQSLAFQSRKQVESNYGFDFISTSVLVVLACVVGVILMPLHIPNGH
jgi:hypothetical protein